MTLGLFQDLKLTPLSFTVGVLTEPLEYESMAHTNFENRTLYTADNLDVMRGMNSESVDLIYLDPPFNSKKNYAAPIGSKAAGAAFKDTWSLDDVKKEWVEALEADNTATWSAITVAGYTHGESAQAYLTYMAVRLLEMRRILKSTGSIYLHCDQTMSHYLKLLMDAILGRRNFRNEIVWCYDRWEAPASHFQRMHDVLLFYARSGEYAFNVKTEIDAKRQKTLDRGYTTNLLADGTRQLIIYAGSEQKPNIKKLRQKTKFDVVHILPADQLGRPLKDYWNINFLHPKANERVGYPTQKPLALVERVIEASSNEGDMVLDPFCGCATTCIAAEKLKRQWVGIDVEEKARDLVVQRLEQVVYKDSLLKGGPGIPHIYHLRKPPKRTDPEAPLRSKNIKSLLYKRQEGRCHGSCGEDGKGRVLDMDLFEIDHIVPRSKGGSDTDDNLQLLCSTCNRKKGSKTMTRFLELMEGE